jgi:ribosome-binding factor A
MRKASSRKALRLEEMIIKELGVILEEEIQDPRLELVTISGVRLNRDLSVAEVLYTHSGTERKKSEVQRGLDSAQGYLRSRLGRRLKLRHTPELRFQWDNFLERMIYESPRNDQ